jgi:hypothetical protein
VRQDHVRNMVPAWEANRRRWDQVKTQKAIDQLVELGWRRSITADGLTLTEPPQEDSVKPSRND